MSWKMDRWTFLVALGIALEAPMPSGLTAGSTGGILVGFLSGLQVGVSAPSAGLAVIVLNAKTQLGLHKTFLTALVAAGLIQNRIETDWR